MLRALAATGSLPAACFVAGRRAWSRSTGSTVAATLEEAAARWPPGSPGAEPPAPAPGRLGACPARCAACSRAERSAARPRPSWPSAWATWPSNAAGRPGHPAAPRASATRPRLPGSGRGGVHPRPAPPDDRPGRARGAAGEEAADPGGGRHPARRRPRLRQPPRPRRCAGAGASASALAPRAPARGGGPRAAGPRPIRRSVAPGGRRSPRPACACARPTPRHGSPPPWSVIPLAG